jgi:pyruvate/2-oxoglutarate dehydrogenase complex dihydrolipoamide acyltransferase (E2) component
LKSQQSCDTADARAGPGREPSFSLLYEEPGLPGWGLPAGLAAAYGGDLGFAQPCTYANFVASLDGVTALGPEEAMPDVLMPRLSDTMETGTLSQWVKHEGDQVRKGDVLAVIETDKAAMDMEAYDEGVLTRLLVPEGASVPIGTPIAVLGDQPAGAAAPSPFPDADAERPVVSPPASQPAAPAAAAAEPRGQQASAAASSPTAPAAPSPAVPPSAGQASPLAHKLAREHGIDLATVTGTGPGGRVVRADIDQAVRRGGGAQPAPVPAAPVAVGPSVPLPVRPLGPPSAAGPPSPALAPAARGPRLAPAVGAKEIRLSAVRRITAQRLADSARDAPHFHLTIEAEVGELLAFRAQANQCGPTEIKISVTDLLVKAGAATPGHQRRDRVRPGRLGRLASAGCLFSVLRSAMQTLGSANGSSRSAVTGARSCSSTPCISPRCRAHTTP